MKLLSPIHHPNQQSPVHNPNQSPVHHPNQQSPVHHPNQQSLVHRPNQKSPVCYLKQQSPICHLKQQSPVCHPKEQSPVCHLRWQRTAKPLETNSVAIPAPLTALHKDMYYNMANDELEKGVEKLFCSLSISEKEAEALVNATIMQQASAQWREQRNGCLTGSIFHDIYVCKRSTRPEPLIKQVIRYEQSDLSHVPAIKWGVENESVARQLYTNVMSMKHDNFACNLTGLWISPLYPHLGASLDGVTTCGCHVDGLVNLSQPGMPILREVKLVGF